MANTCNLILLILLTLLCKPPHPTAMNQHSGNKQKDHLTNQTHCSPARHCGHRRRLWCRCPDQRLPDSPRVSQHIALSTQHTFFPPPPTSSCGNPKTEANHSNKTFQQQQIYPRPHPRLLHPLRLLQPPGAPRPEPRPRYLLGARPDGRQGLHRRRRRAPSCRLRHHRPAASCLLGGNATGRRTAEI